MSNLPVMTYSVGDAFRAPSSFPSSPCPSLYPGNKKCKLVRGIINKAKHDKVIKLNQDLPGIGIYLSRTRKNNWISSYRLSIFRIFSVLPRAKKKFEGRLSRLRFFYRKIRDSVDKETWKDKILNFQKDFSWSTHNFEISWIIPIINQRSLFLIISLTCKQTCPHQ